MTAAEIARRYRVSEDRLQSYSLRGNLPRRCFSDGVVMFDEAAVQRLFPLRDSPASLGVMGVARLGGEPLSGHVVSARSRRVLRAEALSLPGHDLALRKVAG
jgi:hypothetical protein